MKNVMKVLGIIAMLAVIGLVVSCDLLGPADEDAEAVTVTVSGLTAVGTPPVSYVGKYGKIVFTSKNNDMNDVKAKTEPIPITSSGILDKVAMVNNQGKAVGIAPDSPQPFFVWVLISTESDDSPGFLGTKSKFMKNLVYSAKIGNDTKKIKGGDNPFSLSDVTVEPIPPSPSQDFYGTYTANAFTSPYIETVVFSKEEFKISDNEKQAPTTPDHLYFTIEDWTSATVPTDAAYASYTNAYKFTGFITEASPTTTNLYGSQTSPGFTSSDILTASNPGTRCHMYIYYKVGATPGSIVFIRTAFTKESASTDNVNAVTTSDQVTFRTFTKQSSN